MEHAKRYPVNISFTPTSHVTAGNFVIKLILQNKNAAVMRCRTGFKTKKTGVLEIKLLI